MATCWAITATYEDVQGTVYKLAWQFFRKYGGEVDEWISEANLGFMKAYYSFDQDAGTVFNTWLVIKLKSHLSDTARSRFKTSRQGIKRPTTLPLSVLKQEGKESPNKYYPLSRLEVLLRTITEDISDDAKEIVQLIVDSPMDITAALLDYPEGVPLRRKFGSCLTDVLYDFGWDSESVGNAFFEIAEALC